MQSTEKQAMRFDGYTVIVTGAGSGIGEATAERLKAEGATVQGLDVNEGRHVTRIVDICDAEAIGLAIETVLASAPGIDGLVNAAGVAGLGAIQDVDLGTWDHVLAINLRGPMLIARAAAPASIRSGRGAIVNVASIYGMTGGVNNIPYNSAKGGLLQLTRSMAADLARDGVRVNSVSPGYIATPMSSLLDQNRAMRDAFVAMHLLGRPGRSDEVAAAICFLLSQEASFITGVNLPVDGGFSAAAVIPGYQEATDN